MLLLTTPPQKKTKTKQQQHIAGLEYGTDSQPNGDIVLFKNYC